MRRFSIRTLMAFILVSAVGLAALRNAGDLWAGMMLLAALAAVGVAVLGALFSRGKERAWWVGFAFFGGGYLALAVGPWLSDTFQPQLGTTQVLGRLREAMSGSDAEAIGDEEVSSLLGEQKKIEERIGQVRRVMRNPDFDPAVVMLADRFQEIEDRLAANKNAGPRSELFQRVGHCLFVLLAGLIGGMIAVWFYSRRERFNSGAESVSHQSPRPGQDVAEGGG